MRYLITHVTDIEGNGEKFLNIISASSDLECRGADNNLRLCFREGAPTNSQFVYGGDVGDKGPFSLRLMRLLVDFKRREPDRVHLIVGNREAKMTRILDELGAGDARGRLLHSPPAFWNRNRPPAAFVADVMKRSNTHADVEQYVASLTDTECEVLYLKWMLAETMGCGAIKPGGGGADTFELFRREVGETNGGAATEGRVLEELRSLLRPGGAYHDYLSQGVLMHRIGETLFVHGAVTSENLGAVPGCSTPAANLDAWISAVNGWYHEEVARWARGETALAAATAAPGSSALMRSPVWLSAAPASSRLANWPCSCCVHSIKSR